MIYDQDCRAHIHEKNYTYRQQKAHSDWAWGTEGEVPQVMGSEGVMVIL